MLNPRNLRPKDAPPKESVNLRMDPVIAKAMRAWCRENDVTIASLVEAAIAGAIGLPQPARR